MDMFSIDSAVVVKTLWYIAVPSTVFFLLTVISTFIGLGGDDLDVDSDCDVDVDADADVDHDHSHSILGMISFKNLIYFLTFFSWMSLALLDWKLIPIISLVVACLTSIALTFAMNLMFIFLLRFQDDKTTNIKDAEGLEGEVYLTIEPNKTGKVEIILNDTRRIYNARSYNTTIKNGTKIVVLDVDENAGILYVSKDV